MTPTILVLVAVAVVVTSGVVGYGLGLSALDHPGQWEHYFMVRCEWCKLPTGRYSTIEHTSGMCQVCYEKQMAEAERVALLNEATQ